MPLHIRDLRALEGPNIYYSVPGVKLQVWADRDISTTIGDAIKQWAQQVGVVIGALQHDVQQEDEGYLITTTWTTPLPNVGERIAEGAIQDLQAAETQDEDYSHDDALFDAIGERRREEPSLAQLQLYAEARYRDLPMFPVGNGKLMFGSGSRGYVFDPSILSLGMTATIPWEQIGTIPVVAVTGTNGKTTTTRLIAHIVGSTGKRVGRTDTDGIVIGSTTVEQGDWAGWGGARRVLTDPQVDVAVLETSRGGILQRGLGFSSCDVGVVTNISADHLGEFGVETPEQMAAVKGVVVLATKPDGHVVLNADDPIVLALRQWSSAPLILFSRDADNRAVAEHLAESGAAVRSTATAVEVSFGQQSGQIPLADIPITFGGAATHNVENVLAAVAACLGLGLDLPTIAAGLKTFVPDATHNANRLNVFERDGAAVVFDYAHNVAGVTALARFGQQLLQRHGERGAAGDDAAKTGRLIFVLGGPGDRGDDQIREIGRLAGAAADLVLLHEEERYLRGREPGEITELYRAGAVAGAGSPDRIKAFPDELAALDAALAEVQTGDVVLVAAHAERDRMLERLQRWASQ